MKANRLTGRTYEKPAMTVASMPPVIHILTGTDDMNHQPGNPGIRGFNDLDLDANLNYGIDESYDF